MINVSDDLKMTVVTNIDASIDNLFQFIQVYDHWRQFLGLVILLNNNCCLSGNSPDGTNTKSEKAGSYQQIKKKNHHYVNQSKKRREKESVRMSNEGLISVPTMLEY